VQIKKIIDDAINIPDEDNDWMREQLRELAVINGTLRDTDTITYAVTLFCTFCEFLAHIFTILIENVNFSAVFMLLTWVSWGSSHGGLQCLQHSGSVVLAVVSAAQH